MEKKELDLEELEKVSGGAASVGLRLIITYKDSEEDTETKEAEYSQKANPTLAGNESLEYTILMAIAMEWCNENGKIYVDHRRA